MTQPLITPNTQFQIGVTHFPPTGSTVNPALVDLDPVTFYVLDFTAACINGYLGQRFTNVLTTNNITSFPNGLVGSTLPYNPVPYLQQEGLVFPILALWRGAFKVYEADISQHRVETTLHMLYIWKPLTGGNVEILVPFIDAVKNVIVDRNEYGNDAAYNDGYTIATLAGYDSLGVASGERLQVQVPGGKVATELPFESVYLEFKLKEINTKIVGQYPTATGLDGSITLKETGQPDLENFLEFTDPQP